MIMPEMLVEPGRAMVGDAGVVAAEVLLVCRRMPEDERRWVYLDIGRYRRPGGNRGRGDPLSHHRRQRRRTAPVVLAGPTCDGVDVMYEKTPV